MGACCTLDRLPNEGTEDSRLNDGYNSVLLHHDVASSSARYNLVYRPPCLNGRLSPGEPRPRFWVNPYVQSKEAAAIVSVAWEKPPKASYYHYFSRRHCKINSPNNGSFMDACIRGSEIEPKNIDSEIVGAKPTMDSGDNNLMNIKTYPDFLLPFINKVVRLRLVSMDSKMSQLVGAYSHLKQGLHTDPSAELSHLIRNMHWLRLYLTYSREVSGLPQVCVEEHHGGIKRLRKIRYRSMPVSWIDMDHRKPALKIVGDSFVLSLEPPSPTMSREDFPEGNGESPSALGIYIRSLDTDANIEVKFSARLFCQYSREEQEHYNNINTTTNRFLDGESVR